MKTPGFATRSRLLITALVAANVMVGAWLSVSTLKAEETLKRHCTWSSGCGGGTGCYLCLLLPGDTECVGAGTCN